MKYFLNYKIKKLLTNKDLKHLTKTICKNHNFKKKIKK